MTQAVERSLNIYLNAMPHDTDDYETIATLVQNNTFGYSQEYISLLARQEKIDAHKENLNWLSTKQAIENDLNRKK